LAGRAFWRAAAHDDVFNFTRFDIGALNGVFDGMAAHSGAVGHIEPAAAGFRQTGARTRYDYSFS
jgi:hypothetical protein